MQLLLALAYLVLTVALAALTVRIVLDVTRSFARQWRPTGPALVMASAVYAVTDPSLDALRRRIPPLNLGGVGLDLAFLVLFLAVVLLLVSLLALVFWYPLTKKRVDENVAILEERHAAAAASASEQA